MCVSTMCVPWSVCPATWNCTTRSNGMRVEVLRRVEAVVVRRDVDVVHVEQERAVGFFASAREELPLLHRRRRRTRRSVDGFSSASGAPRKSCTCAHALDDVARAPPRCTASARGRACSCRPRRSSTGGRRPSAPARDRAARAARVRYARSSGSVEPIESETPCITIGIALGDRVEEVQRPSRRSACSSRCRISNQSTRRARARGCARSAPSEGRGRCRGSGRPKPIAHGEALAVAR